MNIKFEKNWSHRKFEWQTDRQIVPIKKSHTSWQIVLELCCSLNCSLHHPSTSPLLLIGLDPFTHTSPSSSSSSSFWCWHLTWILMLWLPSPPGAEQDWINDVLLTNFPPRLKVQSVHQPHHSRHKLTHSYTRTEKSGNIKVETLLNFSTKEDTRSVVGNNVSTIPRERKRAREKEGAKQKIVFRYPVQSTRHVAVVIVFVLGV